MKKWRVRVERVYEYEVKADSEDEAYDTFIDGKYEDLDEQTMDIFIEELTE